MWGIRQRNVKHQVVNNLIVLRLHKGKSSPYRKRNFKISDRGHLWIRKPCGWWRAKLSPLSLKTAHTTLKTETGAAGKKMWDVCLKTRDRAGDGRQSRRQHLEHREGWARWGRSYGRAGFPALLLTGHQRQVKESVSRIRGKRGWGRRADLQDMTAVSALHFFMQTNKPH